MGQVMRVTAAIILSFLMWTTAPPTMAGELGPVTNLPLPRFVSLRSSEINVRRGPGLAYRKDWVFRRAGLPVLLIEEYGYWRRIVDKDDAGGWVFHALLTRRRMVLVTAPDVVFREDAVERAPIIARAEEGVVARLRQCLANWCEVEADGHRGWVPKTAVWGVGADEVIGR